MITEQEIPDYRRKRILGHGATAQVWLAEGPPGPVALKVANAGMSLDREIALLRRLSREEGAIPGVVRLLDADARGKWLATEFAPRGRADVWGRGQPLGVLVELAARAAEILAGLHAAGVVHGDLKPSNVVIAEDGTPRLVDFGAARDIGGEGPPPGAWSGTLGFAAPEILQGGAALPAADLYGLGVLLYTLLTRQSPFPDADPAALSYLPLTTLPEPPSSLRPRLPRDLEDLVLALLARRPEARPASAAALAPLLRASLHSQPRSPVVGMGRERELLRRHVVDLLEGKPSVVVLHGSAGSGRRTLIREAVRAATRESVTQVPGGDRKQLLARLAAGGLHVVALDGNAPGAQALLLALIADQAPCLALVRADRPLLDVARMGGRHLCLTPLALDDVSKVLEGHGLDRRRAEDLHRRSHGSPGALMGLLADGPVPMHTLDQPSQRVLTQLGAGPLSVPILANRLALSEHALLDIVEPLIDLGAVVCAADGLWLSLPNQWASR